jgi:uncharacterized protein
MSGPPDSSPEEVESDAAHTPPANGSTLDPPSEEVIRPVEGTGFRSCGNSHSEPRFVTGRDLSRAPSGFVTGHDFSRPASAPKDDGALAPEGSSTGDSTPTPSADASQQISPEIESTIPLGPPRGPDLTAPQTSPPAEEPLFAHYEFIPPTPPAPPRIPHLGHLLLFILLTIGGYLGSVMVELAAMRFHVLGVSTPKQADAEIHYRIGGQVFWYVILLVFCVWIFPLVWRRGFFAGLQWRASSAARNRWRLLAAALACFVAAIADELFIPGPSNAPIDQTFRLPGAAWLLFGFGVTLAPLLEEIAYRGFLLPALCTAYDWTVEQFTASPPPPLEEDGNPRWSMPAMVVASVISSIPFALMHGDQTAYSLGPFVLLVCVSMVLCWVRLGTRSLAASVAVHSSYNLLLFSLMLLGTGGFRHLDKM